MIVEEQKTNLMSLAILLHFLCVQHVRTLIYTSSGACDYSVELPHWSYCSVKTWDLTCLESMRGTTAEIF